MSNQETDRQTATKETTEEYMARLAAKEAEIEARVSAKYRLDNFFEDETEKNSRKYYEEYSEKEPGEVSKEELDYVMDEVGIGLLELGDGRHSYVLPKERRAAVALPALLAMVLAVVGSNIAFGLDYMTTIIWGITFFFATASILVSKRGWFMLVFAILVIAEMCAYAVPLVLLEESSQTVEGGPWLSNAMLMGIFAGLVVEMTFVFQRSLKTKGGRSLYHWMTGILGLAALVFQGIFLADINVGESYPDCGITGETDGLLMLWLANVAAYVSLMMRAESYVRTRDHVKSKMQQFRLFSNKSEEDGDEAGMNNSVSNSECKTEHAGYPHKEKVCLLTIAAMLLATAGTALVFENGHAYLYVFTLLVGLIHLAFAKEWVTLRRPAVAGGLNAFITGLILYLMQAYHVVGIKGLPGILVLVGVTVMNFPWDLFRTAHTTGKTQRNGKWMLTLISGGIALVGMILMYRTFPSWQEAMGDMARYREGIMAYVGLGLMVVSNGIGLTAKILRDRGMTKRDIRLQKEQKNGENTSV